MFSANGRKNLSNMGLGLGRKRFEFMSAFVKNKDIVHSGSKPVFIVGAGRSGNTLLARLLHERGGVHFGPENFNLNTAFTYYVNHVRFMRRNKLLRKTVDILLNQEDSYRWTDTMNVGHMMSSIDNVSTFGGLVDLWYKEYGEYIGYPVKRWGCKTPNTTPFAEYYMRCFPDAFFLFTLRNPHDVVESFLKAKIEGFTRVSAITDFISKCYAIYWSLSLACPDRVMLVTYESLAQSPSEQVDRIVNRLGLQVTEKLIPYNNPDTQYPHLREVNGKIAGVKRYGAYSFDMDACEALQARYMEILKAGGY